METHKIPYCKILKGDMGSLKEKWKISTENTKISFLRTGVWIVYCFMNSVP